jgi:hypothetical protein
VLFSSPQAASAVKHNIESFANNGNAYKQKFTVNFGNPSNNPFKTLPKDGNARNNTNTRSTSGTYNSFGSGSTTSQPTFNATFRGGRGGFSGRGNMGGYSRGGYQQPVPGSYQSGSVSTNNFSNAPAIGGMQPYNNFGNRGGMMGGGMRGGPMNMRGRGGINQNNMMGNYMNGAMNMGGMPNMGMGMPGMGGAMNMQGTLKLS